MPKPARVPLEETVSLRDAKANLSNLTRQAKAGTRVIITNHGAPMADLVQHGAGSSPVLHLKRPGPLPKSFAMIGPGPSASDLVLSDREG
ncbi:MAG: type II toxin-antitoxin system prevent-host-death family antitoxin [Holophaga sp.]|nr:type II toxin-antitoxin system prevent-host-death family antitoxin [Holophaga sp.]